MKYMNAVILFTILITISGCNIDRAPGPTYNLWSKPGANKLEVKKALLECGKYDPNGRFPYERKKIEINVAADFCMERSGFKSDVPAKQWCAPDRAYNYVPVCHGAPIPQRSVARRLNSDYCKKYLKPEHNPEVNTPECLP